MHIWQRGLVVLECRGEAHLRIFLRVYTVITLGDTADLAQTFFSKGDVAWKHKMGCKKYRNDVVKSGKVHKAAIHEHGFSAGTNTFANNEVLKQERLNVNNNVTK